MRWIDLVVFDLAGTTIDDGGGAVLRCLMDAVRAHELPASEAELNALMGMDKLEVFRLVADRALDDDPVRAEATAQAALETFRAGMRDWYDTSLAPIPGAEGAFEYLRSQSIRVAIDTGFDRDITDLVMDRLDWPDRLVDVVVSSSDVPRGRPAPYMIFRAMEAMGVIDVRRVMKIGDSPADLEEGANAGCSEIIGVLSGAHVEATLREYPHTQILESVAALPALMAND